MRIWSRVLVGAALVAGVVAAPAQETDEHLVLGSLFCQLRANGGEQPVRYLLTKALLDAIDAAYATSDAWEKANPGDKPPLGDGIPFQSFPDVADGCGPTKSAVVDGVPMIDISYTFKAYPDADYADRIVVRNENGRPLIDDVLYQTNDYKSGLREILADIAAGKL